MTDQHTTTEMILERVELTGRIDPMGIAYDEPLGFLALKKATGQDSVTVIGFYSPSRGEGGRSQDLLRVVTELDDVPTPDRTISLLGKGVGRRLYNTPQAAAGLAYRPPLVSAYGLTVNRSRILDTRAETDHSLSGKLQRIASHAGRIVASRSRGLEDVIAEVHEGYGDAEAVIIGQPPRAALRQRMRGIVSPVPAAFMIVRRPGDILREIGFSTAHRVR